MRIGRRVGVGVGGASRARQHSRRRTLDTNRTYVHTNIQASALRVCATLHSPLSLSPQTQPLKRAPMGYTQTHTDAPADAFARSEYFREALCFCGGHNTARCASPPRLT